MNSDKCSGGPDTHNAQCPVAPEKESPKILTRDMVLPFVMVAMLFPLWGFANDLTNPLVRAFKDIFLISNTQSSMVQFAFYLGYGVMAIPGALFIRSFSYKSGIVLGLAMYAVGATLFIPASLLQEFNYFLAAIFILTIGLALLEVTANPYILSMGHPKTATRRLNLAQAFNPVGSLAGMFVASSFILNRLQVEEFRVAQRALHPEYQEMLPSVVDGHLTRALSEFAINNPEAHQAMQAADLITVRGPYVMIAAVVAILCLVFVFAKLPKTMKHDHRLTARELGDTFQRLIHNRRYTEGVVAQAFYVGAQITCWTFIIHYGMTELGLTAAQAQGYNIIAMATFLSSRFICTYLLGYIRPGLLLLTLSVGGFLLVLGTILLQGFAGLYCLVGISACMSLMYPTIYGIALRDMGDDASLASAGLVMAIVGGALMPPLQGALIDAGSFIPGLSSVRTSFVLPLVCFVVISLFGYRSHFVHKA